MKVFTDTAGQQWTVEINVEQIKRVRAKCGLDLLKFVEPGNELTTSLGDPLQLVNVLYVLCEHQANVKLLSDEDFGRRFGGDTLDQASDALVQELIGFFPKARRQILTALLDKGRAIQETATTQALAEIEGLDPQKALANLVSRSPATTPSDSSGSSPALSA